MNRLIAFIVVLVLCLASAAAHAAENVIFVTWDGFRWQELFGGAEEALLSKDLGGVPDVPGLRSSYWRESPDERRQALLPFFWTTIARQGQVFGDPARGA